MLIVLNTGAGDRHAIMSGEKYFSEFAVNVNNVRGEAVSQFRRMFYNSKKTRLEARFR